MRQAVQKIVKERVEGVGAHLRRIALILIAAVISALNMKTFIRAGDLFPGGFTGLTLLIQHVARTYFSFELPYSPVMLVMNVIPIVIGFKYIGRRFTLYTCLMVVTSSVLVDLFPDFAIIDDVLLSAVFGGIIAAFCGYLCLCAGASGGGTEIIAIFISEKYGRDLVYSVVAADEVQKVAREIKEADPLAFINIFHSKRILGQFYLRPKD